MARMWLRDPSMSSRASTSILLGLIALIPAHTNAGQSAPTTTGPIRCESCKLSGQTPAPGFDRTKSEVVARLEPVFLPVGPNDQETTVRFVFIARVIGTSPLALEILDSRGQKIDRRMTVLDDKSDGKDPGTCGMSLVPAVSAEAASILPTLSFNDIVTGAWMMQRDLQNPQNFMGRPVVSDLRKPAEPVAYFHPVPATANCFNRSGRLIEYINPAGELLVVYNDGGIQFSTQFGKVFAEPRLSADELQDLLKAFGASGIDALPTLSAEAVRVSGSKLTLVAARYQTVLTDPPNPKLEPVVERLNDLKARAMSNARLVLKAGPARTIDAGEAANAEEVMSAIRAQNARTIRVVARPDGTVEKGPMSADRFPEQTALYGQRYVWPRELGVRLSDVPADGLIVPWSEVEKHKPIFYALLNARSRGLNMVEGSQMFERVRLCQVDPGVFDSCGSE